MQANPIFFSSLVWHLAGMCFVQVGRLERCCCCLRGLLCDGSDTNDALWVVIILFCQDVLLAAASWYAVDITFSLRLLLLLRVMNISPKKKEGATKDGRHSRIRPVVNLAGFEISIGQAGIAECSSAA